MRNLAGNYAMTDEKKAFFVQAFALPSSVVLEDRTPIQTSTSEKYIVSLKGEPLYFIKQIPFYAEHEEAVRKRAEFLRFLQEKNFQIPSLVWKEQDPFIIFEFKKWQLFHYVDGHACTRDDASKKEGFKLLYEFYILSNQFFSRRISQKCLSPYLFSQIFHLLKILKEENRLPAELEKLVLQLYKDILASPKTHDCKILTVHGDFSLNNILFQGSKATYLVDFDNIAENAIERDLAEYILTSYCFTYAKNSTHFSSEIPSLISLATTLKILRSQFPGHANFFSETVLSVYLLCVYCELILLGFVRDDYELSENNIKFLRRELQKQ